jgi:hypothetical protein
VTALVIVIVAISAILSLVIAYTVRERLLDVERKMRSMDKALNARVDEGMTFGLEAHTHLQSEIEQTRKEFLIRSNAMGDMIRERPTTDSVLTLIKENQPIPIHPIKYDE